MVGVASLLKMGSSSFVKKVGAAIASRRRVEEMRDTDSPEIAASKTLEEIS